MPQAAVATWPGWLTGLGVPPSQHPWGAISQGAVLESRCDEDKFPQQMKSQIPFPLHAESSSAKSKLTW